MKNSSCLTIGIAGGTGSGKTTVAQTILGDVAEGSVAYIAHDAYYKDLADLPQMQRDSLNFLLAPQVHIQNQPMRLLAQVLHEP